VQLDADRRVRLFALIKLLKLLPKRESPVAHRRIVPGRVLAGPPQSFDADHVLAQFVTVTGDLHLANVFQEAFQLIRPRERVAPENGFERRLFLLGGHRLGPVS
jgi:hypothetical protein